MPLTKADRLAISKKMVEIPEENKMSDLITDQLGIAKAIALEKDEANKKLVNLELVFINEYQVELGRYDGVQRTELIEDDFESSVLKLRNNPFFPNDPSKPVLSVPDGIWKNFVPISVTKAIGKTSLGALGSTVTKEQDLIDIINGIITTIEGYTPIQRATGQKCTPGEYPPPDNIDKDDTLRGHFDDCKVAVQNWENFLNVTYGLITTTDTNPTRSAQNIASKNDITNIIAIIDAWQALADYDEGHGQNTCAGFNSYDPNLLSPTKFRIAELDIFKAGIANRQSFVATRIGQIETNLGSITVDPNNGQIVSVSGFYGRRFRYIDLRLNLMSGSLAAVKAAEQGQKAQAESKASNNNALAAYEDIMMVTPFKAPSTGNNIIQVDSSNGFVISDPIYVASNTRDEISAIITNIVGNIVYLNINIPQGYRQDDGARLYKVLI